MSPQDKFGRRAEMQTNGWASNTQSSGAASTATTRSIEPRHPSVILGAIREQIDGLTKRYGQSFAQPRLIELCEELDQALTIQQFQNSLTLLSHPEPAKLTNVSDLRRSSGSTVRNERQRFTRTCKGDC